MKNFFKHSFLSLLILVSVYSFSQGIVSTNSRPFTSFDAQAEQDLILFLNPARLRTMMEEGSQTAGDHTPVDSDGDLVGTIYGLDVGGSKCKASTSGNRPTLGSGTLNSYLTSNGTGIFDYVGSTTKYKFFHAVTPVWSYRFAIFMSAATDGTSKVLAFTNASTPSSSNYGLHIERTTGNKIRIRCGRATGGTYMIDYTTTASITVASGLVYVQITVNSTGATAGTIYLNSTSESFNVLSGVDNVSSTNMSMFSTAGTNYSHIQAYTRVLSSQEITDYQSYNPVRDNEWFQTLRFHFDFSDQSKLYSDAGATVNVNNGDEIYVAKNQVTLPSAYFVDRRLTGDTQKPVWNSSVQNGLGAAVFDGTACDNLIFSSAVFGEAPKGRWMMVAVLKNNDAASGSRFLQSSSYMVITGSNYSGFYNDPYFIVHYTGAASSPGTALKLRNYIDDPVIVFAFRDGDNLYTFNGLNEKGSGVLTVDANYINMGYPGGAGGDSAWCMDGPIYEMKIWYGGAEFGEIQDEMTRLQLKWGITK